MNRPDSVRARLSAALMVAISVTVAALSAQQPAIPAESKCQPIAQRNARTGCWILADQSVGSFAAKDVFWHLDRYPSKARAEAAKGSRGIALEALGQYWVVAIEPANLPGVTHTATVGPLPVSVGVPYSAMYMQTITPPGFQSAVHTHAGPEAWYNVAGAMCLETSEGVIRDKAGSNGVFVRGDIPMLLTSTGSLERQAMVLVLHESARPPITIEHTWTPKGECKSPERRQVPTR